MDDVEIGDVEIGDVEIDALEVEIFVPNTEEVRKGFKEVRESEKALEELKKKCF